MVQQGIPIRSISHTFQEEDEILVLKYWYPGVNQQRNTVIFLRLSKYNLITLISYHCLIAGNAGYTVVNLSFHGEGTEDTMVENEHDKYINILLEVSHCLPKLALCSSGFVM